MIEHYSQAATGATDWAEWERWDDLLHRAIAEASGNGLLINIVDQLLRIKVHPKWTLSHATTFDRSLVTRYASEHRAVIAHIIGRDGGGAEAAMRRHMLSLTLTVGPAIAAQHRCPRRFWRKGQLRSLPIRRLGERCWPNALLCLPFHQMEVPGVDGRRLIQSGAPADGCAVAAAIV